MERLVQQIEIYRKYVMSLYNKEDTFFYKLADTLFFWGMIASLSTGQKNYDEHFEKMVRSVRISVSRNSGIEGIIEENKGINTKVTDNFSLAIFSVFLDFYLEILNNKVPFEKRRDLDTQLIACYYAGRLAGKRKKQKVIDPEERRYNLYMKYNQARRIAEMTIGAHLGGEENL